MTSSKSQRKTMPLTFYVPFTGADPSVAISNPARSTCKPLQLRFLRNEGFQRIALYGESRFYLETHLATSQRYRCKAFPVLPLGFDIVFMQLMGRFL
jgi:hypothetical protein